MFQAVMIVLLMYDEDLTQNFYEGYRSMKTEFGSTVGGIIRYGNHLGHGTKKQERKSVKIKPKNDPGVVADSEVPDGDDLSE